MHITFVIGLPVSSQLNYFFLLPLIQKVDCSVIQAILFFNFLHAICQRRKQPMGEESSPLQSGGILQQVRLATSALVYGHMEEIIGGRALLTWYAPRQSNQNIVKIVQKIVIKIRYCH
jgi:hypothetical protein